MTPGFYLHSDLRKDEGIRNLELTPVDTQLLSHQCLWACLELVIISPMHKAFRYHQQEDHCLEPHVGFIGFPRTFRSHTGEE